MQLGQRDTLHLFFLVRMFLPALPAENSLALVTLVTVRPAEPDPALATFREYRIRTGLFLRWGHKK